MLEKYDEITINCSKLITRTYSTSFSLGIRLLNKKLRNPVYAIYGFVRLADEIVDTFHKQDKSSLLVQFKDDTFQAVADKFSLNPVLHAFQAVVNQYNIDHELIHTFLRSMEMDLSETNHNDESYKEYVLGSAEVVGLMCLAIFCNEYKQKYAELKPYAQKLGAAYQKINFLRDISADYHKLGRVYFPKLDIDQFDNESKLKIENDIEEDFKFGYEGIKKLPDNVKLGVYISYIYYFALFKKVRKTKPEKILQSRIRISNFQKYLLLAKSYLKFRLKMV